MPRAKNHGPSEPKRRSRNGCWPCKSRKVKCGEEHPSCQNCLRTGDTCDYRIRLNWEGRRIKRRNVADGDSNDTFPSSPLLSNGILEGSQPSADNIGVPLQRYATEPTSNTGPIQYEFEHTLFDDLHQISTANPPATVTKKKAKSMDDSYCLDRSSTEIRFVPRGKVSGQSSFIEYYADLHSPTSTTSTNEELVASRAEQNDAPKEPYYLEQTQSPGEYQWSGAWNTRTALDQMASGSPLLSNVACCTSDEMAFQSTWEDSLTVETSVHNSSVDDARDGSVECRPLFPRLTQVGSSDPYRSMKWTGSKQSWVADQSSGKPVFTMLNNLTTAPGNSKDGRDTASWLTNDDRKQALGYLPAEISVIPHKLKDQTNMLYFEHFVNHTAKVMAPYNSKEANPFSNFLPAIAFRSEILMSLLLAFSAAHRAQILRITEPDLRIAEWANDIFPSLRLQLSDQTKEVPDDVLVSMVLLTSLEKSSPNAFGHSIPWQKHLSLTRSLMDKRIGNFHVHEESNEDFSFIWSWFSYLDTMGQASVGESDAGAPYQTGPFDLVSRVAVDDEDEFDCGMGFTTRCGRLLTELASQIRRCRSASAGTDGTCDSSTAEAAVELESRFKESMTKPLKVCRHIRKNKTDMRDLTEMDAASEAFHWAGIVCLRRRILRKPSSDEEVQNGVQRIWECIQHIRREKEADTACVFPLFVAGCETNDVAQRRLILARFKSAEKSGMKQVKRARKLMETSWRENLPWYQLIQGEFLG